MENCIYSEMSVWFRGCGAVQTTTAIYVPVVRIPGIVKKMIIGTVSQYDLDVYISVNGHSLKLTEDQLSEMLKDIGIMQTLEIYKMANRPYLVFTNTPV